MTKAPGIPHELNVLIDTEKLMKRVQELGREISEQYRGKTLHAVCVLDDSFMFAADLMRAIDVPVIASFVKPRFNESPTKTGALLQIFFSPEIEVRGEDVLLIEGLVTTGITAEFLIRNLYGRGAKSVKMVALLEKQVDRRVPLQPDFFGFQVEEGSLLGYGLGMPKSGLGRNLPYIAHVASQTATATK
jgi:hypoxanthine phosphoribosyltransferase